MAPSFCPVWGSALLRAEAEKRKEGAQPVQGAEQALSRASTKKKKAKQLALGGKKVERAAKLHGCLLMDVCSCAVNMCACRDTWGGL